MHSNASEHYLKYDAWFKGYFAYSEDKLNPYNPEKDINKFIEWDRGYEDARTEVDDDRYYE